LLVVGNCLQAVPVKVRAVQQRKEQVERKKCVASFFGRREVV